MRKIQSHPILLLGLWFTAAALCAHSGALAAAAIGGQADRDAVTGRPASGMPVAFAATNRIAVPAAGISVVAAGVNWAAVPSATVQGAGSAAPAVTVPTAGVLALSSSSYPIAQSAGVLKVTVTRSGAANGPATVNYATHDGTAVAGINYVAASGKLTWAGGDASSKSVNIALDAAAFTGSKSFSVTLSSVAGASLGAPSAATATILASGPAARLALKLGVPARLLLGVGDQGSADPIAAIRSESLKVDIYERYLGQGDWTSWNSPPCDYVCVVADAAASVGAVPMYTQYQMANDGDGNLAPLRDAAFMATYWARVKLMYQDIAAFGKPALVNLEPDFWGYVERAAPDSDPTQMAAIVNTNPDCSTLDNNVAGVAGCLIAMARKYAPKAYIGFPPSAWGGNTDADVVAFMNAIGAQKADFIVEQTLDRDAGCFEIAIQPSYCVRSGSGWYWDEKNVTHPNFQDHLNEAQAYHAGIGSLPIIWWQTPEGVPSTTPGGSAYHYRDNRAHYFLTHPTQLTAVGGLAVVFSAGESHQTTITTDGGQFQALDREYLAAPAPLP